MAVDALDFDRCADLTIELGIPVAVLVEVAIDAVHSFFGVDIHQVDWDTVTLFAVDFLEFIRGFHSGHQGRSRGLLDLLAFVVEQVALAILFEHGAEDPAVAVEVGELGVLEEWIQFAHAREELGVPP